jgi:polyphenol oxidase
MLTKQQFFGTDLPINKLAINQTNLQSQISQCGFDNSPIILVNQVHGNNILIIDNAKNIPTKAIEADAIICCISNINIGILTADCVPIILHDNMQKIIAVIHAGWHGALTDIAYKTAQKMYDLGSKAENITAKIGPCIRQQSYEVGAEFYENFLQKNDKNDRFFIKSSQKNHFLFDLPSFVKENLQNAGVKNIKDTEIDSYDNKDYFSHRRSTHLAENDEMRNLTLASIN